MRDDNLYVVKCQPVINRGKEDQKAATVATTNSTMDTWHQQLGHINNLDISCSILWRKDLLGHLLWCEIEAKCESRL